MRRLVLVAVSVLAASVIGCGSWKRVGSEEQPRPTETLTRLLNTTQFYQRLGRLAAGDPMPFVGTVAFAAGPGDSVIAVLGLSLENRSFAFQREGNSFVARYRVALSFKRDGAPPVDLAREELVRVATFQETQRADESVLFQQVLRLVPGKYQVTATVRDASSAAESNATGEYTAPKYGTATYSAPVLTYQATGRGNRADPLNLVLNPRGAVGYGSDTLLAYVEGYAFPGPATVPFKVLDEENNTIYDDSLRFRGGREVESQVVRLAPDSVSLGELEIVVGSVITNFDEMLDLLRYFGMDEMIARMRRAPANERAKLWRDFYTATDPNTSTPENEALNQYFGRVSAANQRFKDEGVPGWRTDRGEVLISLGPPDESVENTPGTASRVIRWTYLTHRLEIYFEDETGFGRLRLTPASRSEYERILSRVRRQEG
jgi:GWxTD domain-containing protein